MRWTPLEGFLHFFEIRVLNDPMYNEKAESAKRKASVCATMNFMAVIEVGRAPVQSVLFHRQ